MQEQMSFLETLPPAGLAPVWAALDDEQRALVVAALARLIAKVGTFPDEQAPVGTEETLDE